MVVNSQKTELGQTQAERDAFKASVEVSKNLVTELERKLSHKKATELQVRKQTGPSVATNSGEFVDAFVE